MEGYFLTHFFITAVLLVSCKCQDALNYSVNEESKNGTFVGNVGSDSNLRSTVSAEDFSQIGYSILSQEQHYEHYFAIDAQNGSIVTNAVVDRENIPACVYETTCVLSLSIVAKSEISAFFRTLKVNITITDINDHSPTFPQLSTSLHISELATVKSSIAIVGAVDADSGIYSLQRYYILNEDSIDVPFETSYEKFVDGSSVVKLVLTGDLNREIKDEYSLVIVAEDGGDPKLTGTIAVNIVIDDANDNSPNFTQTSYKATINETVDIGAEIIQLTAFDADMGINSEVIYKLSRNQVGLIHELFAINETSGVLSVKGQFSSGGQYRVIVEASDNGVQRLMTQTVVLITVLDSNNNPPVITVNLFSTSGIATISEYADIGTVVAHVKLIDTDTGLNGIIQCDISSDDSAFTLQGLDLNEYKVTVAKELDREKMDFIYVIINCYDKGSPPLNSFSEFTVKVLDENDHSPSFLQEKYVIDILENNEVNSDIVQVSAIDIDIGKNAEITYSVWATGAYQFYMDPLSGIIKTMSVFDRETNDTISFLAYAIDGGNPARTSTATVIINVLDINDNDPHFDKPMYEFNVTENAAKGTRVGVVTSGDADVDDNQRLSLFISPDLPFTVESNGDIRTTAVLDRENKSLYNFLITVYDHGVPSRNSSANIVVHVLDQNDHEPQFIFPASDNYTVNVQEDIQQETVVATIRAFDLDDGVNSQLFYAIQNTNVSDLFSIDGYTGEITLVRPFTSTNREIYTLRIRVDDNGNPRKFTTTSMSLFITRIKSTTDGPSTKGENLLIAISLGTVTFVIVFTAILVICILKKRNNAKKNTSESEDRFYEKDKPSKEKKVQFADLASGSKLTSSAVTKAPILESMTTFSSDGNESRDSEMSASTVDMEVPILERSKKNTMDRHSPVLTSHIDARTPLSSQEKHLPSPRSETTPRSDSTPRSDMMSTLQSHNALLHSAIKPHSPFSTFGHDGNHDDNHSHTSGETTASDSGRGGSESDIHSALSHSHDSDIRPTQFRPSRNQGHTTFKELNKPWMNLADIQNHPCNKLPIVQQLKNDKRHRLQIRNFSEKKSNRRASDVINLNDVPRIPCTDNHHKFDMSKFAPPLHSSTIFPPPPSDLDRSYMTYDDDDDDMSTTTSGSYTIDHEDVTLDIRGSGMSSAGLRGCLV